MSELTEEHMQKIKAERREAEYDRGQRLSAAFAVIEDLCRDEDALLRVEIFARNMLNGKELRNLRILCDSCTPQQLGTWIGACDGSKIPAMVGKAVEDCLEKDEYGFAAELIAAVGAA